jgi:hypothetical protein
MVSIGFGYGNHQDLLSLAACNLATVAKGLFGIGFARLNDDGMTRDKACKIADRREIGYG